MNAAKTNFLLTIACLIVVSLGCRSTNYQPPRPEDEVIRLKGFGASPKAKDGNYKRGDSVTLVKNDGGIEFGKEIYATCGEMLLVRSSSGREEWLISSEAERELSESNTKVVVKTSSKCYQFEFGGGRVKYYRHFPAEQVFPAPWANKDFKVGDVVYKKDRNYASQKGVIAEIPVPPSRRFRVRFGEDKNLTEVGAGEIWSSIEPAKVEDLSPGDFVYYDEKAWAMVIGKRDDKILIREEEDATTGDELVHISKLQILK